MVYSIYLYNMLYSNIFNIWFKDRPDSPLSGDDIDLALAALMKGLPGIDCAELETLLNDLPMPEPGAKDGISVKEAVEVSLYAT